MSHAELRKELETRLKSLMEANYPDVLVDWENSGLDRDNEDVIIVPTMLPGKTFVSSVGRKSIRTAGVFQIDVLVPKDIGTGVMEEICEFLSDYFSAKEYTLSGTAGYAVMKEGSSRLIGMRNGKYRKVVSTPYRIDTIKS
jgi:hypothetical protein